MTADVLAPTGVISEHCADCKLDKLVPNHCLANANFYRQLDPGVIRIIRLKRKFWRHSRKLSFYMFQHDDLIIWKLFHFTGLLQASDTGHRLNINTVFPGIGIPMLKIRRSLDRLIFNMGIPILVRRHLYTKTAPWLLPSQRTSDVKLDTHVGSLEWAHDIHFLQ